MYWTLLNTIVYKCRLLPHASVAPCALSMYTYSEWGLSVETCCPHTLLAPVVLLYMSTVHQPLYTYTVEPGAGCTEYCTCVLFTWPNRLCCLALCLAQRLKEWGLSQPDGPHSYTHSVGISTHTLVTHQLWCRFNKFMIGIKYTR